MPGNGSRSARGVAALVAATQRANDLTTQLKSVLEEVKRLEEDELPNAFTEDGISELALPDGSKAKRDISVKGSLPTDEAARQNAIEWLCLNGQEANIQSVVSCSYSRGNREIAHAVYDQLRRDNRAFVTLKDDLHHSSLRALVLARVRAGEITPVEDLGCTVVRRVKIDKMPR